MRHLGHNTTTDWQNDYQGNIDNHHYDPWTRRYHNGGSARDWDAEYDLWPYPDWQDYDCCTNAFLLLNMPGRNSRNLTLEAAQSDSDTSHQEKQHSHKGNTLGAGTPEINPSVADQEPPVFSPHTFLQSEESPLTDSVQQKLQKGQRRKRKNQQQRCHNREAEGWGWGGADNRDTTHL